MTIDTGGWPTVPGSSIVPPGISMTTNPVAAIRDETRYVLAAPLRRPLFQGEAQISRKSVVSVEIPLSGAMARAGRILLESKVKVGRTPWHELPSVIVEPGDGELRVRQSFEVPAKFAGKRARVNVVGFALNWADDVSYAVPPVYIPEGATFEFGFGVLPQAWDGGPVEFTIDGCVSRSCERLFAEVLDPASDSARSWHDRTLELGRFAGKSLALEFKTARARRDDGGFTFPVWANPTLYAPAPRPDDALNVILLSIDTLRADHLTSYGYEHDTAPFIEQTFGEGGTVFEQCVAAATSTSPSHMSMFTGLTPSTHGVTSGLQSIPHWIYPLAEPVRAAKIETAAITENGWLSAHHGFARGFNTYAENRSPNIMAPTGQVDVTFARAKSWLSRNHDKQFFLFLHTFQVHDPYVAPESYQQMFTRVGNEEVTSDSPTHLQELVGYDQEIRYTDDELAGLFRTLRDYGLDRNTVFILTSDHGEGFLEHGFMRHSAHFYQEVTRVPLMFRGPGISGGRRIGEPVGHIDIAPTVLDLFDVPAPMNVQGRSVVPLLEGRSVDARRMFVTESWSKLAQIANRKFSRFGVPSFNVRSGDHKLARYRTGDESHYEMYDVASDPGETDNIYRPDAAEAQRLQSFLTDYQQQAQQWRSRLMTDNTGQTGVASVPSVGLDPEQEEKLRALGYLR